MSQIASSRGVTGWSSSVVQRPIAAASSRPIRPPPTMPMRTTLTRRRASASSAGAPSCTTDISAAVIFGRVVVLDDVAAVDDARRALLEHGVGALEDLLVGDAAAAAQQQRDAGDLDDAVVLADVVGRVGLDHVGAELGRLADDAQDALEVAAPPITPAPAGLERERLDHQRHAGAVALGAQLADVSRQSRRSWSWPGTSSRLTTTQAASRRTAWPTGSSIMNDHASAGASAA